MVVTISSFLIHHHLPSRASNRGKLRCLFNTLNIPLYEISDQEPIANKATSVKERLLVVSKATLRIYSSALIGWQCKGFPLSRCIKTFLAETARAIALFLSYSTKEWTSAHRIRDVENILVSKHISSWQTGLASDSDWVLVCEDDAEIRSDTILRIKSLVMDQLKYVQSSAPLFIDLAGGYPPEMVLPIPPAQANSQSWTFKSILTNTTCSYLVSNGLVKLWLQQINLKPWLKNLPADHLINMTSFQVCASRNDCASWHWKRPIFLHGSFTNGSSSISSTRL